MKTQKCQVFHYRYINILNLSDIIQQFLLNRWLWLNGRHRYINMSSSLHLNKVVALCNFVISQCTAFPL